MTRPADSSIRVSAATRREINDRKREGESHDDVVQRLFRKADALDAVEADGDATEERLALAELQLRESRHRADILEQRVRSLQEQLEEIESLTEATDFDIPEAQPSASTPDS